MQIATGRFAGNGAFARTIVTGLSGSIRSLVVTNGNSQQAAFKNDLIPGFGYDNADGSGGNAIQFSGADFVVNDNGQINTAGVTYDWTAWSD